MVPQSIRWRLPITYAAIALINSLVLGAVLLGILNGYYQRHEKNYLKSNAKDLEGIGPLYGSDVPLDMIRSQLDPVALFAQIRIRMLDLDQQVVYDSGSPNKLQTMDLLIDGELSDNELTTNKEGKVLAVSSDLLKNIFIYTIDIPESDRAEIHFSGYTTDLTSMNLVPGGSIVFGNLRDPVEYNLTYPIDINAAGVSPEEVDHFLHRSDERIKIPIYDEDDQLMGYLEVFEGPSFGYWIISRVGRVLAIASIIATIIAALVGWAISRPMSRPLLKLNEVTERMANGDLSVRADTSPRGEIGQLAHSFNSMAAQVEKTISTLRQFVADAAHELNTPLTALRTNLELIIDTPDPVRQQEFVARAKKQTERLQKLTNNLLELSRIEGRVYYEAPGSTDATRLLREYSELYASWAEQAELTLITEVPTEPVMIPLTEKQLGHLVHNLLENAIKFTPQSGTIVLGLREIDDSQIQLWVEDTGIGILAEDLPHLFERFHRGQNATSYPGHGLGLAIVRLIAQSAGGTAQAQNTPHGARFTIRFPVVKNK
jgi:signal transduction histidine kinase